MSIYDISEPEDADARQAANLPPLVGNLQDLRQTWRNWSEGKELCTRCRGTGNELWSMYKSCRDCGGSGSIGSVFARP